MLERSSSSSSVFSVVDRVFGHDGVPLAPWSGGVVGLGVGPLPQGSLSEFARLGTGWGLFGEVGQAVRAEELGELLVGEQAVFEHEFRDALAGGEGFLGDGRGRGVAELRVQGGDEADGLFHGAAQVFGVGGDSPKQRERVLAAMKTSPLAGLQPGLP